MTKQFFLLLNSGDMLWICGFLCNCCEFVVEPERVSMTRNVLTAELQLKGRRVEIQILKFALFINNCLNTSLGYSSNLKKNYNFSYRSSTIIYLFHHFSFEYNVISHGPHAPNYCQPNQISCPFGFIPLDQLLSRL